jgi:acyl-CoA synthetase (AMP-forming)/AMP-acid ligase II
MTAKFLFSDTATFVDLLQSRAMRDPDAVAYRFLGDGEAESARITYSQQDQLARSIAAVLEEKNAFGERALLLYPPTLDFINAFLGCLYAGVIAVPAYPPRSNRSLPRLFAMAADAKPRLILTTAATLHFIEPWVKQAFGTGEIEVIATDKITPDTADNWRGRTIHSDGVAFLQYTSGSTSSPKGVIVSHASLMHNEEMIRQAFRQSESSVIVSWLPLYHDMGLIGGVLQPLYAGAQCVLMSPLAFVQKPWRWLNAINRYRATTSGGPNFAYDLCVRKINEEQRAALDLSSWNVAFNGAEPVRAETLAQFARTFAPCGFRKKSFFPCYGLAEATLFVSGGQVEEEPVVCSLQTAELQQGRVAETTGEGQKLVGCGGPWMGQQVVIVDPETESECASGEVGEICVAGPSVALGYWNKPEETEKVFHARNGTSLRTGDLGFFRNGELFVIGRLKDLIIVRGRNFLKPKVKSALWWFRKLRTGRNPADWKNSWKR